MRILHYIPSTAAWVGGPSRFVLDASRMMADAGHDLTVMTWDPTNSPEEWLDLNHDRCVASSSTSIGKPAVCPVGQRPMAGGLFGPSAMRLAKDHIKRADVLHLHGIFEPSNVQLAAMARKMGIPYVVTAHGMLDDWCMEQRAAKKRVYMSLVGRRYLEKAARVHLTAQAELDQSKKWFPGGAETIIPYLFDLDPYKTLPGRELAENKFEFLRENDSPTVLFLSRLHYKKGPELLIQAAAKLRQWGITGKVALAGMGEKDYIDSLQTLAATLGISENVLFLGPVVGTEKISLYQSADLFVLPTSQENFGLVLIEALACGTPLITTKGVDIWKDLEASGAAEIVDQRPDMLAQSIASLLEDKSRRETMGAKARPWVFDNFNEERLCSQYSSLYEATAAMA